MLRNRLNAWCESEQKLNDAQFGFRENRSTSDCIFIHHNIIQKVLANKLKLYCAFIDYQKAFDTVIHDALWMKLTNSQISSKMLKMLKSLYSNVKACTRNNENMSYSELFDLTLGVKQGETLSPLLFILFINDIKDYIDLTNLSVNDIDKLSRNNYTRSIINIDVEIVDSFCYLGMTLYYNGNFNQAIKHLMNRHSKHIMVFYHCLPEYHLILKPSYYCLTLKLRRLFYMVARYGAYMTLRK